MTRYAVFVAMLLSIAVLRRRGPQAAFLDVWLPFFLLMPFAFWVNIPGLPDPNFMQAAILPILVVLLREHGGRMNLGRMECLVAVYVVVRVVADYLGRGYSDAQNYAFYMLSSLVGPYLIGRYLVDSRAMDIATARRFVLLFLLLFPMFLFELKFWVTPAYKLLSPLFPDAGSGLSLRYGIARTAGPFEHPILACIMVVAVYRLHRWLAWTGEWERVQPGWMGRVQGWSRRLPIHLQHQITIALVLMALMTISRGPWIGAFAGAAVAAVGTFRDRRKGLLIVFMVLVVGAVAAKLALDAYTTPKIGQVLSQEAQTMLYRQVMVDRYMNFLLDKLWTGWGLTRVPKIEGMESIDNAFFLMALQHGVLALAAFAAIFVYAIASQLKFALKAPRGGEPPIGFTFAGIYMTCFVAFSTVYMGSQTEPLLFLLLGWGESIKRRAAALAPGNEPLGVAAPAFRRVMV
jgi:O-Antigen ligase